MSLQFQTSLAACQDFQYAEESKYKKESSIRFPSEPNFEPDSDFEDESSIRFASEPDFEPDFDSKKELSIHFPSDSDFNDDFEFIIVHGMMTKPVGGGGSRETLTPSWTFYVDPY